MKQSTMQWLLTNGLDNSLVLGKDNNSTVIGSLAHKVLFNNEINIRDLSTSKNKAFCYEYICDNFILRCAQKTKESVCEARFQTAVAPSAISTSYLEKALVPQNEMHSH